MIREIKITSLTGRGVVTMASRQYWAYWLGEVDWGQVEGNHQSYSYLNQVGESIVSTTVRSRPISIQGWVMNIDGNMQERCDFLNQFISPVEDYELEYKGKKIQFRPDISVKYGRPYMSNNEMVREFLIQGTCPYPLFQDSENTEVLFNQTIKLFHFPTDFGQSKPLSFANVSRAYRTTINNRGGFSTGITARIKFTGGVTGPRIRSLTAGKLIGIDRVFERGEQVEINSHPGRKTITLYNSDGTTENLIKYRDYETSWFLLQPGNNDISYECENEDERDNMEVTLFYTPLYLEVE